MYLHSGAGLNISLCVIWLLVAWFCQHRLVNGSQSHFAWRESGRNQSPKPVSKHCRFSLRVHEETLNLQGIQRRNFLKGDLFVDNVPVKRIETCNLVKRHKRRKKQNSKSNFKGEHLLRYENKHRKGLKRTHDSRGSGHILLGWRDFKFGPEVLYHLLSGRHIRCGAVQSCVHVTTDAGMKMEHTSLQKIGRHLLNMAENEVEPLAVTTQSLVLQAVGAVLAVTTLVVVLALCVCKEKEQMSTQEVQLTSRTPLGERKSRGESVANEETKPVPSEEIKVENEVDKRQSNGSVASGRERPKSHDRALPDIPVVTADPQDPEEDGNYSVITNRANGASNLPQAKEGKKSDHKNRHHPYEKVDGFLTPPGGSSEDTDDGYAGVGGNNPYPYAVVTDVGNAEYAKVEKGQTREPPGVKPENKIAVPDITYASVTSPPVPEKRFSNNEEPENSGSRVSAAGGHSPDLPPRNSMPGHGDMTTSNQNGLVTASVGGASIVTVVPGPVGNPPGGATSGRRSPPYSKITARESLQNMRERGAALEDVTYECVNYEQVKMPDTTANSGQDNRSSLTSELYAEISGTGTGQNSQADPSYGVPTPPPVENLPRQLASMREKDQEAGYAGIRPGRPLSAVSVGSGKGGPEDVANLYSKVDKNRKNRTTIHVSENLQLDPEGGDSAQLYAQVDKTKKSHDQCPSSNREAFGGARPKVKDTKEGKGHSGVNHNSVESASHRDSADPGYMKVQDHNLDAGFNTVSGSGNGIYPINRETIDPDYQMVGDLTGNSNTTTTVTIDPHYSTVRDSIENGSIDNQEIDPNYETVPNVNGMIGSHPGMIHVSSLKVSTNQNWQRREHVYQEIHEAKLDKKFNKANKKQKSDKTQL